MKTKKIVLVILAVAVVSLAATAGTFAEELKVAAGSTASAAILTPVKEHFEKASGMTLTIYTAGSKAAMMDLEKGAVAAAVAAHSFEELIGVLKKEIPSTDPAAFHWNAVADPTKLAVVVNPKNQVAKLTKEQLKGIFTGKVTSWKDIGGTDAPVIPVLAKLVPLTNNAIAKQILDGESFTKDLIDATTSDDVRQSVAANLEGIGFLPAASVNATVKIVEAPVVTLNPVVVVTKGVPSSAVQKLIDYVVGEGKKHIKQ